VTQLFFLLKKTMACKAYKEKNPIPPKTDEYTYLQNKSSVDGPLCSTRYSDSGCQKQCTRMSKNYQGCFSCLSSKISCPIYTIGGKTSCCPNIQEATECNNCLSRYDRNELQQCLSPGLSTGEIAGIAVGCIVGVGILSVIIWVIIKSRRNFSAKNSLQSSVGKNSKASDLIKSLNQDSVGGDVFKIVEQRSKLLKKSRNASPPISQKSNNPFEI
jgi:hypothetical protein